MRISRLHDQGEKARGKQLIERGGDSGSSWEFSSDSPDLKPLQLPHA
jgi:hypothetical protein